MVAGVPCICIRQTGICSLAAHSTACSFVKARMSFQIWAPAAAHSVMISGREVSIEIITSRFAAIFFTTGRTREASSSAETKAAPGRVDSPPISIMSAPSFTICTAWLNAVFLSINLPPSEKESGVTFKIPITAGVVRSRVRLLKLICIIFSLKLNQIFCSKFMRGFL